MIKIDDYHLKVNERLTLSQVLTKGLFETCTRKCDANCEQCPDRKICDLVNDILITLDK